MRLREEKIRTFLFFLLCYLKKNFAEIYSFNCDFKKNVYFSIWKKMRNSVNINLFLKILSKKTYKTSSNAT